MIGTIILTQASNGQKVAVRTAAIRAVTSGKDNGNIVTDIWFEGGDVLRFLEEMPLVLDLMAKSEAK